MRGFNKRRLYRINPFYETYEGNEKMSPLVTQLSWSNHIMLLSACKCPKECLFYMNLAIKEQYRKRKMHHSQGIGLIAFKNPQRAFCASGVFLLAITPLSPALRNSPSAFLSRRG